MPLDKDENVMAPGGVVPFEISQQKASQLFKSWIKGKFFAPNAAKKSCEAKNFSGVYLPFWTYDSQTTSPYQVELGYRHERTNSKGETETYYEYKHFSGIYEKQDVFSTVPAAVLTDNDDPQLKTVLEQLEKSEKPVLKVSYLSAEEAERQLKEETVEGIIRSLRFGTSLSSDLSEQAASARASRRAKLEERVAKAPVKMLLPVGALILPAMLMLVLGPILLELMNGF
jgi:hypothetical protein